MPQFEKIEPQPTRPYRVRLTRLDEGLLRCNVCGEYKSFGAFSRSRSHPHGRAPGCNTCNYRFVKAWREKNPDRVARMRVAKAERELVARRAAYAAVAIWLRSAADQDAVLRSLLANHLPADHLPGQMAAAMRTFKREIKRFERSAVGRTVDDERASDRTREERKQ